MNALHIPPVETRSSKEILSEFQGDDHGVSAALDRALKIVRTSSSIRSLPDMQLLDDRVTIVAGQLAHQRLGKKENVRKEEIDEEKRKIHASLISALSREWGIADRFRELDEYRTKTQKKDEPLPQETRSK